MRASLHGPRTIGASAAVCSALGAGGRISTASTAWVMRAATGSTAFCIVLQPESTITATINAPALVLCITPRIPQHSVLREINDREQDAHEDEPEYRRQQQRQRMMLTDGISVPSGLGGDETSNRINPAEKLGHQQRRSRAPERALLRRQQPHCHGQARKPHHGVE